MFQKWWNSGNKRQEKEKEKEKEKETTNNSGG